MQRAHGRRTASLLLATTLALGLAGCGNDDGDPAATDETATEDTTDDTMDDDEAMDDDATDDATDDTTDDTMDDDEAMDDDAMDDHEDEDGDHTEFAFGEPAEAADADRTIEVDANDDLTYDPPSITVQAGETITFAVTNTGQAVHEFTLGDTAFQAEHEQEMADMMAEGEMMDHVDPNTLSLEPGESGELTWHFTEAGEVLYGCHQPGHYAGGMVGSIDVEA